MMSNVVVGVADCKWSRTPGEVLITYALGSCLAVTLHDPLMPVAGMLHYMLPDSRIDRRKADRRPFMFADTGVPILVQRLCEMGGRVNRMTVRVAGGAQVLDTNGHFDIGRRNYLALREILQDAGLMIHAENVGGIASRTVSLDVITGRFLWREADGGKGELMINGDQGRV